MARSVADVATAYQILKGADGHDGYAWFGPDTVVPSLTETGKPLRIGWIVDGAFGPVDSDVAAAVRDAAAALRQFGFDVKEVKLPIFEQNNFGPLSVTIMAAEFSPYLRNVVGDRVSELSPLGEWNRSAAAPSLEVYVAAELKVEELKDAFAEYFAHFDMLLTITTPWPAQKPGQAEYMINGENVSSQNTYRATVAFNLSGLPAMTVPFRFSSEHLPIGVQLVSRWLDEATLLRLGLLLETVSDVHGLRPQL